MVLGLNIVIYYFNDVALLISRSKEVYALPPCFWNRSSFMVMFGLFCFWLLVNGVDTRRFPQTEVTTLWQIAGAIGFGAGLAGVYWITEWNYSTAVVLQSRDVGEHTTFSMGALLVRAPSHVSYELYFIADGIIDAGLNFRAAGGYVTGILDDPTYLL